MRFVQQQSRRTTSADDQWEQVFPVPRVTETVDADTDEIDEVLAENDASA